MNLVVFFVLELKNLRKINLNKKALLRWRFELDFSELTNYATTIKLFFNTYRYFCTREEQKKLVSEGKSDNLDSAHLHWLAKDIMLLDSEYEADWNNIVGYTKLGEYWKSLGPGHVWGGDFKLKNGGRDYNHFELKDT